MIFQQGHSSIQTCHPLDTTYANFQVYGSSTSNNQEPQAPDLLGLLAPGRPSP